ncbi:MAG: hypothetical protein JWL96_3750 [Sphingomonas bacterium]|nr:hypothetical protein [Sphingomonas bacterium]
MTNKIRAAMFGAIASLSAAPALAGSPDAIAPRQGHFEWRNTASAGPRAPLSAPQRVWISSGSDARHMAACDDCPMMDGHQASARTS